MKMQKFVIFVMKNLKINIKEKETHRNVRGHCHHTGEYKGAANIMCNLKYRVPKKIPLAFHNGSNYDYNFIIKELAEEFKKPFTCFGETLKNT